MAAGRYVRPLGVAIWAHRIFRVADGGPGYSARLNSGSPRWRPGAGIYAAAEAELRNEACITERPMRGRWGGRGGALGPEERYFETVEQPAPFRAADPCASEFTKRQAGEDCAGTGSRDQERSTTRDPQPSSGCVEAIAAAARGDFRPGEATRRSLTFGRDFQKNHRRPDRVCHGPKAVAFTAGTARVPGLPHALLELLDHSPTADPTPAIEDFPALNIAHGQRRWRRRPYVPGSTGCTLTPNFFTRIHREGSRAAQDLRSP